MASETKQGETKQGETKQGETKQIVMLHGWGWRNYTARAGAGADPWANRRALVDPLSARYQTRILRFPGFCGEPEPRDGRPWDLRQYARWLEHQLDGTSPDAVLGYSFGGAVAAEWRHAYPSSAKLVLISPALVRRYARRNVGRLGRLLPGPLRDFARDVYLTRVVRNPFYTYGTPFLRGSYRKIVAVNASDRLRGVPPEDVCLIFGAEDTATPPGLFAQAAAPALQARMRVLPNSGHNVGAEQPEAVVAAIVTFLEGSP